MHILSIDSSKPKNNGFALVVALGLMAFVLLLLLSITTLVQVETRSSSTQIKRIEASENAKLGILAALGELQKHAGQDQRVSAQAAILDAAPDTRGTDGIEHPFWTGIWDVSDGADATSNSSYAQDYANRAMAFRQSRASNAVWLISGNEGKRPTDNGYIHPGLELAAMDPVRLFGSEGQAVTNVAGDSVRVYAPQVEILDDGGNEVGSYAFWVGDEGVKAKVSFQDPFEGEADERKNLRSLTPANIALPAFPAFSSVDMTQSEPFSKIQSTRDLLVATGYGTEAEIEAIGHDVTAHSAGVLADVRFGGLKKDLTAAFTNAAEYARLQLFSNVYHQGKSGYSDPVDQIFPAQNSGNPTDDDPGGPRWLQLKSYFDLAAPGALAVTAQTDDHVGLYPIVSSAQLFFGGSVPFPGQLRLHLFPAVVLWNPYNVDLPLTDYTVAFGRIGRDRYFYGEQSLYMQGWQNGDTSPGFYGENLNGVPNPHQGSDYAARLSHGRGIPGDFNDGFVFTIPQSVIPAGQAIVYSPPANDPYDLSTVTSNTLTPGARATTSSYYIDLIMNPTVQPEHLQSGRYYSSRDATFAFSLYKGTLNAPYTKDALGDTRSDPNGVDSLPILHQITGLNFAGHLRGVLGAEVNHDTSGAGWVSPEDVMGMRIQLLTSDNSNPMVAPAGSNWLRTNPDLEWLANANPRARFSGPTKYDGVVNTNRKNFDGSGWPEHARSNPAYDINQVEDSTGFDITTSGINAAIGSPNTFSLPLFEVPESVQQIQSIGQLMHANLYKMETPTQEANITTMNNRDFVMNRIVPHARYANSIPAYSIGNSLADPKIQLGETYVDWGDFTVDPLWRSSLFQVQSLHYDYSYLLNDVLWDTYFLSAIPADDWGDAGNADFYMPNQRMQMREAVNTNNPFDTVASNVLIDGAFNVNSVSVEAWSAFIGGFLGVTPDRAGGGDATVPGNAALYSRFMKPMGDLVDVSVSSPESADETYEGYRALSISEIKTLAETVVLEVKERGPFLSMSDFVNRRLVDETGNHAGQVNQLKGALQEAIDRANINGNLDAIDLDNPSANFDLKSTLDLHDAFSTLNARTIFDEEATSTASGVPGHLTQADLLARVGSVVQVRSDTFIIRSYGSSNSSLNADDEVEVWCEAVVQRNVEFVDAADAPSEAIGSALAQDNRNYGRRFEIVSFRWLDKDEI